MKKNIIMLGIICILQGVAWGQSHVVSEPHIVDAVSSVIREYNYPSTVTCVNIDDGTTRFILSNPNMQTIERVITGYYVNDMVLDVAKDSAFFCGYMLDDYHHAIIGFFNISSLFYGSGSISVQEVFTHQHTYDYVSNMTRMVSYLNSNNERHVVCIGNTKEKSPCITDMSVGGSNNYTVGLLKESSEIFTDIKYIHTSTKDYLVTSGRNMPNNTRWYITLRYFDPNIVVSTPGFQDDENTYCVATSTNPTGEWFGENVVLTQINDSIIATVSLKEKYFSPPAYGTDWVSSHVAFYNFNAILSGSLYGMTKSIEIDQQTRDLDGKMHRVTHSDSSERMVFLYSIIFPCSTSLGGNLFCDVDYNMLGSAGTINVYNFPNNKLQGLDTYHGGVQYVMSGFHATSPNSHRYEVETFGVNSGCAESEERNYKEVPVYESIRTYRPFVIHVGRNSIKTVKYGKQELPLHRICDSQ